MLKPSFIFDKFIFWFFNKKYPFISSIKLLSSNWLNKLLLFNINPFLLLEDINNGVFDCINEENELSE